MSTDKKMQFYQLLRDFLTDYLVTRRNFSDKTVRAYKQSLKLLRKYFSDEKGISFDSMDFSCFSRSIYMAISCGLKIHATVLIRPSTSG